jgi:serine/threonine-protein kinase HipA
VSDSFCYVYVQLPGTYEWVPCASLKVTEVASGAFEGTFTYGKRYLERANVLALDPYRLKLTARPMKFTMLKGIPGALRDASPDAWGRRVIQARLQRQESEISEMEYLLNGPDDGAGNLRFGLALQPPGPAKPFNRTHQLEALVRAAQQLEESGRLPREVIEQLEPGTSMGGARPKASVEDGHRLYLAKLPEKNDKHNMQRIEYATLELARAAGLQVCGTRIEAVGQAEALLLLRFDREWNPDVGAYARHGPGPVSTAGRQRVAIQKGRQRGAKRSWSRSSSEASQQSGRPFLVATRRESACWAGMLRSPACPGASQGSAVRLACRPNRHFRVASRSANRP